MSEQEYKKDSCKQVAIDMLKEIDKGNYNVFLATITLPIDFFDRFDLRLRTLGVYVKYEEGVDEL